jgi:hypothetical protein
VDRDIASSRLGEMAMVRRYRFGGDGFEVLHCVIRGLFVGWTEEFARVRTLWFIAQSTLASSSL